MQYRVGDLLSKFGGTKMGVLECVEVLDELAKSEGFAAQSHAGLEALELASEGYGFGEHRGGEDDHGGVPGNLEELVHTNLGVKVKDQISCWPVVAGKWPMAPD